MSVNKVDKEYFEFYFSNLSQISHILSLVLKTPLTRTFG